MKLAGAVTEGSGAINEDGYGIIEKDGDISAAWIFDGVTGINGRNYLPGGSDAAWLVRRAGGHLKRLAAGASALPDILSELVTSLIGDWDAAAPALDLPASYDPPAACLILVKRFGPEWKALRLGDSCLLARQGNGDHVIHAASPNNAFDHWLSGEAKKRRARGTLDIGELLAEFQPQLNNARRKRNQPGGYSILECSAAALAMPEYISLGAPQDILLCTDGYYRAADHYGLHDNASLIDANVADVLAAVRAAEAADPRCERFLRFKPSDDATAVMLRR